METETPEKLEVQEISPAELMGGLEDGPEPTPGALARLQERLAPESAAPEAARLSAPPQSAKPRLTDDFGEMFNPAVHETDQNGNPVYSASKKLHGKKRFRKLRGRKSADEFAPPRPAASLNSPPPPPPPPDVEAAEAAAAREAARGAVAGLAARFYFGVSTQIYGPKAAPIQNGMIDEEAALRDALTELAKYYNLDAPESPWAAVLVVIGWHQVRVNFDQEATKHRAKWWDGARQKLAFFRAFGRVKKWFAWSDKATTPAEPTPEPQAA